MTSRRGTVQLPAMWARWALAIVVAVAVIAGIVIAVNRAGPEGATTEAGAEAEINRVSDIAISEDEAPHSAAFAPGSAPAKALEGAIAGDVRQRIADTQLTGPLQSVTCRTAGASSGARRPYNCTVRSASIAYPFQAVLDEARHRLTWCKIDQPAVAGAGPEIPISTSCRA